MSLTRRQKRSSMGGTFDSKRLAPWILTFGHTKKLKKGPDDPGLAWLASDSFSSSVDDHSIPPYPPVAVTGTMYIGASVTEGFRLCDDCWRAWFWYWFCPGLCGYCEYCWYCGY